MLTHAFKYTMCDTWPEADKNGIVLCVIWNVEEINLTFTFT